jgi:predicted metal-dependent phosphoesterase TrpH
VRRWWVPATLVLALISGTMADRPRDREPITADDYFVLSGDFHLHSGLTSGGTMTPWGLVGEALRQDLDVIAITGHNEAWGGRVARAFSRIAAGPIVLTGEEVTSATQDLIAVGIQSTVLPDLSLIDQIAEIHRQGGVAIAPHPIGRFHRPYLDAGALKAIDGTEVCHPVIYERQGSAEELIAFAATTNATPIGSSDFHASGRVGVCRTFLFTREATARGVLEAIRDHRTVVYALNGRAFGDPLLVQKADALGLREVAASYTRARGGLLDWISRLGAIAALAGIALATKPLSTRPAAGGLESDRPAPAPHP